MSLSRRLVAVSILLLAAVPLAYAWGPEGHRIVAELAQRQLTPAAEAQVEHLLAPEHTTRLADVANWADDLRNDPDQQALWKQTRPLHYLDFGDPHCHYVPPRDCPHGRCVVAALEHYVAVLGDRNRSELERRQALKFVVHFVGDIHQPLHAGSRDDKGGNTFQVQFDGKGSNLHRVWDSGLLGTRNLDWQAYANMLAARGPVQLPAGGSSAASPYVQWAEESCRATTRPGFYPDDRTLGPDYVRAERPLAEQRLRIAGKRLAQVLNQALAH